MQAPSQLVEIGDAKRAIEINAPNSCKNKQSNFNRESSETPFFHTSLARYLSTEPRETVVEHEGNSNSAFGDIVKS